MLILRIFLYVMICGINFLVHLYETLHSEFKIVKISCFQAHIKEGGGSKGQNRPHLRCAWYLQEIIFINSPFQKYKK